MKSTDRVNQNPTQSVGSSQTTTQQTSGKNAAATDGGGDLLAETETQGGREGETTAL